MGCTEPTPPPDGPRGGGGGPDCEADCCSDESPNSGSAASAGSGGLNGSGLPGFGLFPGGGSGSGGSGGSGGDGDSSACCDTGVADPINSSTGEFHFSVTDLRINGPIPIVITRSYANQRKYDSPYGYNWTINYDARIISVAGNTLTYVNHKAGTVEYSRITQNPDVYALPGNSSHYFVKTTSPAGFDLVMVNEGLTYHFVTGGTNDGRLTHIRDDYGNQISFEHNIVGFITRITDTLGRDIRFFYNSNFRLSQIYDMTGNRRWYYYYSSEYDLIRVEYPDTDEYSELNRIKFTYIYNDHSLVGAIDPRGVILVWNRYVYDSGRQVHKVYKQERAGGSHDITYDTVNKVSTVIDPEGNKKEIYYNTSGLKTKEIVFTADPQANPNQYVTEYFYDALMRNTLVIHPAGNCTAYTFNADNMRTGEYRKTSPGIPNNPAHPNVIATLYEYDTQHATKVKTETDALGNETHYEYNTAGLVTKITYPEIQTPNGLEIAVEEFTYNTAGRIETYTNPAGSVRKYVYWSTTGFLKEVIEDFGAEPEHLNLTTSYTYDNLGRTKTVTKPDGAVTELFYNTHDQVIKEISPEGYETLYAYDENGNRKQIKRQTSNPLNPWQITGFTYDQWGNLTKMTDALGNKTSYEYDKNERRKLVRDALDQETRYFYDERGLLAKVTDPNDKDTLFAYDLNGNRIGVTDTNGNITTYEYDGLNRLVKTIDAEGHYRIRTPDKLGRVVREIAYDCKGTPEDAEDDVALMQIRLAYNEAGDLVEYAVMADVDSSTSVNPNIDKVTRYAFAWANGPMLEETVYYGGDGVVAATAATTSHEYDVLGREVRIEDPDGNVTTYTYDAAGRPIRIQVLDLNPIGNDILQTTDFVYDLQGRLTFRIEKPENPNAQSDTSWQTTQYVHDALDNQVQEIRPNGVVVAYQYDLLGRKTSMTVDPYDAQSNPDGIHQITEYGYDALGRQEWIAGYADNTDEDTRQITMYEYDSLGRVTKITYPDLATIEYAYTPAGKVSKRTDQRGWETDYTYDNVYNMTQKQVTVDSVTTTETFIYDGLGRLLSAQKQEGSYPMSRSVFAYNGIGRMSDAWETIGSLSQKHIQYSYDNAGHRTRTVYPDASAIDRTNTWNGRINTLSRDATTLVDYQYVGPRVARWTYPVPNIATDMTYDNRRRVRTIDAGTNLIKFTYDYAANSNNIDRIIFEYRPGSPYNQYTYDNLDRLTEADYLVGLLTEDETFGMDDLGNRTTVNLRSGVDQVYTTDTPNLTNRYTAVDGQPLDYDASGNLTQDYDGYRYVYDYENRVTRIHKLDGYMEINIAEYRYDALGRRIAKYDSIAHEMTLYYHNDEWQVLAEYDLVGHLRNFIYGNYIDEPLVMDDGTDYYYVHDHLYSTAALLDESGNIVEHYEYDAYGTTNIMDASYNVRTVSAYGNSYIFTGRQLDVLDQGRLLRMYYRHRDYSPQFGRFVQHDSFGMVPSRRKDRLAIENLQYFDGLNLYVYAQPNPLGNVDPSGLMSNCDCDTEMEDLLKDPDVKKYYDEANSKRNFWGTCLKGGMKCKDCKDKNLLGTYNTFSRNITLCSGSHSGKNDLKKTIIHELIHAISLCGYGPSGCSGCMEEEKRAYYESGSCIDDISCTESAWNSCTGGWFSPCNGKKKDDYYGVGWPVSKIFP